MSKVTDAEIKRAVEKYGSQLQAAKALGISQSAVSRRLPRTNRGGHITRTPRHPVWSSSDIRHYPEA